MGLLTPLYLAGLAALSLPLLFHLIRRTPRGRQTFSTLMFLTPSPPRLTRRSRLDNLLLLLLRAAVLALLAMAFARPFLREASLLQLDDAPARRVAILLDDSASMRRADLWPQALAKVEAVLADLGKNDDLALFTFSDRLRTVVDFEREGAAPTKNKPDLVRQQLKSLQPTWRTTDLAAALVAVASELDASSDPSQSSAQPHLVLVSDLQRGARTDALQAFAWPERVRVVTHRVATPQTTNAIAHLLADEQVDESNEPRVRVVNAAGASSDQFFVRWQQGPSQDKAGGRDEERVAVHVPPGQSRVIRLSRPESRLLADRLVLEGDDEPFDNVHYIVPPRQQQVTLVYVGDDGQEEQGLCYYLELAVAGDPLRKVEVSRVSPKQEKWLSPEQRPELLVVSAAASTAQRDELRRYAEGGGTLLLVPKDRAAAESVVGLFDDVRMAQAEADGDASDGYLMLGEIDFTHPLFLPLSSPRYNDFTKVHFWRHRALEIQPATASRETPEPAGESQDPELAADAAASRSSTSPVASRVIARFDNHQPALLERATGKGTTLLLASGWHPEESQLALSSKFVPLVHNLLEIACGGAASVASILVGERALLPATSSGDSIEVHKPDGTHVALPAGARQFDDADQPGMYQVRAGEQVLGFAVNLPTSESNTAPLDLEQLEQLGVRFGVELTHAERVQQQRQQRDTELESRQKVWRWLIVAALVCVILETTLAGRTARQNAASMETVA